MSETKDSWRKAGLSFAALGTAFLTCVVETAKAVEPHVKKAADWVKEEIDKTNQPGENNEPAK